MTPLPAGVSVALRDVLLRQQVRAKAGRRTKPSVTIIDSQSVKTISKGGQRGDMTQAKRSKGASVT